MAAIKIPLFDHEDLEKIVTEKIEELKEQFIPKYVIEDAIDKISHAAIPDRYQDEYERAAYADGQGEAILILQECLKEAADGKSKEEQSSGDDNI